jgi:hypothetical protein
MKAGALGRTLWRIRFGRAYGPVMRQIAEWMNRNIAVEFERKKSTGFVTSEVLFQ